MSEALSLFAPPSAGFGLTVQTSYQTRVHVPADVQMPLLTPQRVDAETLAQLSKRPRSRGRRSCPATLDLFGGAL